tara:strand:+ start:145 stop:423 length:279 start_codon:yes stop_codon:yes gene_type:complete
MNEAIKVIQNELKKLQYSKDAILDMINLLKKAIELSKEENPDRRNNPFLNNLIQTKEKELSELLDEDISVKERERRFENAKSHFMADFDSYK